MDIKNKPFNDEEEKIKYEEIQNNLSHKLDEIEQLSDTNVRKYIEILVSSILFEMNKIYPEPNYSFFITYRFKSDKSNIEKVSDYIRRLKEDNKSISIKEIYDLIGLRIIVDKIPNNITISKNNPEYETLNKLNNDRKENIKTSESYHDFEQNINDGNCTYYDYYTKSKELLQKIIDTFKSEYVYSEDYASDLVEKYTNLIAECEKKLTILKALGEFDSPIDLQYLQNDYSSSRIDFSELLRDFDSKIDGKLALYLFSSTFPNLINNSSLLQSLGVTVSNNEHRTKFKRQKSGYISNFFGMDFEVISPYAEFQIMSENEHKESISGYSAHSKMSGKEPDFMEIPPAYKNRNMQMIKDIGKSEIITNEQLHLINSISTIKSVNKDYLYLFKELTNENNIVFDNNSPIGVKIETKYLEKLKKFCRLTSNQKEQLEQILYRKGCKIFDAWAKNISAVHVTASIDKDPFTKDRIKFHYDSPYECLAHTIREQIENNNPNSINAEYYLRHIYQNQSEWLTASNEMPTESSIMYYEIEEYAKKTLHNTFKDEER